MQTLIPDFVVSIFELLGGMTIPLIMIILGGNIYIDYTKKGNLEIFEIIKFVIIKNIVFPLIFIGILVYIKPSVHIALIILLQSAVTVVSAVHLMTEIM